MNLFPALVPRNRVSPPVFQAPQGPVVTRVSRQDLDVLMALCDLHGQAARQAASDIDAQGGMLELMEALFDPPLRAWAWIARARETAMGYAAATIGYSLLERGYYLRLESLYVDPAHRGRNVEADLLAAVRDTAARMGCIAMHWQHGASLSPLRVEGAHVDAAGNGMLRLSGPVAS
ncbi:N-acetyltransferase family protein [Pseudoxanthomonas beigongshangi]